jgi:hypothetical protein
MIHSTMMDDYPLTIGAILRRGSRVYGTGECVTWTPATTGDPKGVVYSHRSTFLHAIGVTSASMHGITEGAGT